MGGCIRQVAALSGVLETILLYRLGWDLCILAVIGRWLLTQVSLYTHCESLVALNTSCEHVLQWLNPS